MRTRTIFQAIISILIAEAMGVIGAFFTTPAINGWYAGLAKSALTPPGWVFGPVWTLLYALMGIAAFIVWRRRGQVSAKGNIASRRTFRLAILFYAAQLALNLLWSIIFFGLHASGAAFGEIVVLWLFILLTIIFFARISKTAAWLLVPYILWVSFATYLNFAIWYLN